MSFIAIIILIIILKFIFDTYLTNNTESRYNQYKSTVFGIRADGIYYFKHKGISIYKEKFIIHHVLVFNSHGLVTYAELDDRDGSQLFSSENKITFIDSLVTESNKISQQEEGFVQYKKKGNKLEIIFNGNRYPKKENWMDRNLGANIFRGNLDHNNLILSYENIYFDEILGQPKTHNYFTNQKFIFLPGSASLKNLTNSLND